MTPSFELPAKTLRFAYQACDPDRELEVGDPRYTDLSLARGNESLIDPITRRLENSLPDVPIKQFVTGHRGCGKSTELRKLVQKLESQRYFVVLIDADDELDKGDISWTDILMVIASKVSQALIDKNIWTEKNKGAFDKMNAFLSESEITESRETERSAAVEAKASVGSGIPDLFQWIKLDALLEITNSLKRTNTRREEVRRKLERSHQDFIGALNQILREARVAIQGKDKADLIVIIDSLEKLQYKPLPDNQSTHTKLFIESARELLSPECHMVYTLPISMLRNANLIDVYGNGTERVVLPMINVQSDAGKQCLRQVVAKRLDVPTLFEKPTDIDLLIEISGGSIRDLIEMVRVCCDTRSNRITTQDVNLSIKRLMENYKYLLREEDIPTLVKVANAKEALSDEKYARLFHYRLILEYRNGELWADVHPAVKSLKVVKEAIARSQNGNDRV